MTLTYRCSSSIIDQIVNKMKKHSIVAQDALFNEAAPDQLRKEITYRDLDFLLRLGRTAEIETVDSIAEFLKIKDLVHSDRSYNKELFLKLRKEVKTKFNVPWTSISPVMERLLFMLSSFKKPKYIFAAGIFCGNTLIWNAAPGLMESSDNPDTKILAVDIDKKAIELAENNFNSLDFNAGVNLVCEDALIAAEKIDHKLDYVYLDADCKERGKKIYLDILKILYPKIKKNGWVLAHDTTEWCFQEDFIKYKTFVRNKNNFTESVSFDIDPYGLELSIK